MNQAPNPVANVNNNPQQQQNPQQNPRPASSSSNQQQAGGSTRPEGEPQVFEEKVQMVNGEQAIKRYECGPLLGRGGFAKCFQVTNVETKKVMAAKIIPKSTLVKNRARQKLVSEIKIHKSLHNNNIVKFEHVFEDQENVYILLELCPHQTLNELIKRRKRITEIETLCYTVQIVQALKYLHSNRVIHRDLKLGNLFVGDRMEIKLGDFGLATKLEFTGEKKRTICGTPNYIAPEILDGRVGHSYEVDVWSLGVIIYTLLIGKPPFETTDVKKTYARIKEGKYSFPENVPIPESAKSLIQLILQQDPAKRPTLDEILAHSFINNGGTIPRLLPITTLQNAPTASYIKQYAPSASNLKANQQSMAITTEMFSSRQQSNVLQKSSTTTNMLKGSGNNIDQNLNNNYYPEDKKQMQPNQFMSSANLQQGGNNKHNYGGGAPLNTEFQNKVGGDSRPVTSGNSSNIFDGKGGAGLKSHPNIAAAGSSQRQSQSGGLLQATSQQPQVSDSTGMVDGSKNNLWVSQYVDYTSKYGLGYLLSNGSSGVVFNDGTKIVLDPKGTYLEYIYKKDNEEVMERHGISEYPSEIQKKVTLLQHFRNYLVTESTKKMLAEGENGGGSTKLSSTYQQQANKPLPYLKKWMQTRNSIMFRLSNKMVQVLFSDKTEILLNSQDKIVSFMNKLGQRSHYLLADAMTSNNVDMTKRLRYTKDILTHLLRNNNNRNQNQNDQQIPQNIEEPAQGGGPITVVVDEIEQQQQHQNLGFDDNDIPKQMQQQQNKLTTGQLTAASSKGIVGLNQVGGGGGGQQSQQQLASNNQFAPNNNGNKK